MKTKKLSIIYFLAALVLFSCKDDKDDMDTMSASGNPVGIVENSHTSGQTVSVDFRGRITNQQGEPIAGATVSAGGSVTITNAQGFYQIIDAIVDNQYALVKVEFGGKFDQFRALKPKQSGTNLVDITMIDKVANGFFSTSSGGVVDIPGGASVSFPAGELVTTGGQPYSGEVVVSTTYLDPSDPELMSYMPGSLAAVSEDGEPVGMITYGMVGVELLGATNGQQLQLAGNRKATLTLPLPETHTSHAPESISLWYFDETAGIWQEEGEASKQGSSYVGQVSHFSFWNCDVSVNTAVLEGNLVLSSSDFPISSLLVKLTRPNGSSAWAQVGAEGYFSGIIPSDEILQFEVIASECDEVLYEDEIGPFSEDTDLGEIELEISSIDLGIISLSGSIVDCDGEPMENVFITYEEIGSNVNGYFVTDEFGFYSASIPCLEEGTIVFEPFSLSELIQGEIFSLDYELSESEQYDLGQVALCDGEVIFEYLNYSDGTNELSFDEVEFIPSDDEECGELAAFLQGSGSTDYTDGIGLLNFDISDSLDFWGACSLEIEIRGYLSNGNYLVASVPAGQTIFDIIQQIEDGTTTLLEATMTYGEAFSGVTEVNIYEDDMSTTPLSTYEPDEVNIDFLVVYEE
ncbi:carboxypeptidase-like regulatory domain-containing protein [Cryomorphaceae bacterium 1068]|nr:carboxypeptidase-like regulatory domain-containing protein [Cryomorphaceae bacterium 1068]